jgi:photosystem II stability/assembly factor-like uncharacterized protein
MICFDLGIDPFNNTFYLAGSTAFEGLDAGIYKSHDGGQNWEQASESLPLVERSNMGYDKWGPIDIYSIAIDPNDMRRLYAGGHGGLYRSTDGGSLWIESHEFPSKYVTEITVHSEKSNIVLAIVDGTTEGDHLYKSTDYCSTFAQLPLSQRNIETAIFDPFSPEVIYAGGENAVYRSTDEGESWETIDDDLEGLTTSCLLLDPDSHVLYAGTNGGSIYKHGRPPVWSRKGDVNGDGQTDVRDVLLLVSVVLGTETLPNDAVWCADCNSDGHINILDIVGIVHKILGTDTCEP